MKLVIVAGPLGVGKTSSMHSLLGDAVLRVRSVDECVENSQTYATHFAHLFHDGEVTTRDYDSLYFHVRNTECDADFMDDFYRLLNLGCDIAYETTGSQIPLWSLEIASSRGYDVDLVYLLTSHGEALRRVREREKRTLAAYHSGGYNPAPRLTGSATFDAVYASSVRSCMEVVRNESVSKKFRSVSLYDNQYDLRLIYSTNPSYGCEKDAQEFLSSLE
jgi:hypothetical protein